MKWPLPTVCLFGPESTGKTTLARELAARFGTVFVPEFGRYYCEAFGHECDATDLRRSDSLNGDSAAGNGQLQRAFRRVAASQPEHETGKETVAGTDARAL